MGQTITITQPKPKIKTQIPFFRVLGYFKELRWRILAVIGLGIVGIYIYSILPGFQKDAINSLDENLDPGTGPEMNFIIKALFLMLALEIINEIFAFFCIFMIIKYENKVMAQVLSDVKHKLDVVPTAFLEQFTSGDLTRRVAHNAGDLVKTMLVTIYKFSRVSFFYVTTSIMMFNINTVLAFVAISSLPICILTARIVSKHTQKFFRNNTAQSANMTTYFDQKISLHGFYKMNGLDGNSEEFAETNEALAKSQVGEDTATALNTIYITFINNLYYLLVTVICGIFFINGSLVGFGALPVFLTYSKRFLDNATVITDATNLFQIITGRADRVFAILDCPDDITEKEHINIESIEGDIAFNNVTLIENGEKILDGVSFTIPKGANVAFVGPTGSGKSRIVELIAKLAVATEGKITVDGTNIDEITSHSYHERMGIAFERPFIFQGTIAENILYGVGRALPETVMKVTKKLGSHAFIENLPKSYETELWENTTLLTASQKQALNIARTVLEAPDLVLIDEALSQADIMTEKYVYEQIMQRDKKQTTIFVTHRLASIEKCDMIIYMENGKIAEQGTHEQLMKRKRKYYKAAAAANN